MQITRTYGPSQIYAQIYSWLWCALPRPGSYLENSMNKKTSPSTYKKKSLSKRQQIFGAFLHQHQKMKLFRFKSFPTVEHTHRPQILDGQCHTLRCGASFFLFVWCPLPPICQTSWKPQECRLMALSQNARFGRSWCDFCGIGIDSLFDEY